MYKDTDDEDIYVKLVAWKSDIFQSYESLSLECDAHFPYRFTDDVMRAFTAGRMCKALSINVNGLTSTGLDILCSCPYKQINLLGLEIHGDVAAEDEAREFDTQMHMHLRDENNDNHNDNDHDDMLIFREPRHHDQPHQMGTSLSLKSIGQLKNLRSLWLEFHYDFTTLFTELSHLPHLEQIGYFIGSGSRSRSGLELNEGEELLLRNTNQQRQLRNMTAITINQQHHANTHLYRRV
jgi:hypothetical protein